MNKDLLNKLSHEYRLTAAEEAVVDKGLSSPAQDAVRQIVGALPEDEPSMAWRSRLNERVLEMGRSIDRKRRALMFWRPALGLGLAASLAMVFTLNQGIEQIQSTRRAGSLEAALLQEHAVAVSSAELAGLGLASHEAVPQGAGSADQITNWEEADVETL